LNQENLNENQGWSGIQKVATKNVNQEKLMSQSFDRRLATYMNKSQIVKPLLP
jgi:hypothetical protein